MQTFKRTDILLPNNTDMAKWSVVACDQFTSQPEYWKKLEELTQNVPSALHLILPEAYLDSKNQQEAALIINREMQRYLDEDVFRTVSNCFIFVERTLASGIVRRGLIGVLDLENYDYSKDSVSPIRATEGTVETRLPPRVAVRRDACLEMPHVMVFIDDKADCVMGFAEKHTDTFEKCYDFDLNAGGGHIRGYIISGKAADQIDSLIASLSDKEKLSAEYGDKAPAIFAMGDGNHSLATAKKCWEEIKESLSPEELENHPARYSMVELVNIHDDAISFEPIHRVIFGTDNTPFFEEAINYFSAFDNDSITYTIHLVLSGAGKTITAKAPTIGMLIERAETFCSCYVKSHGGNVDYIHNDDTAVAMGKKEGCAAMLLPKMNKTELFPSIIKSGPFPKKSFSIGHAEDKRYYLECRIIKK